MFLVVQLSTNWPKRNPITLRTNYTAELAAHEERLREGYALPPSGDGHAVVLDRREDVGFLDHGCFINRTWIPSFA